MNLTVQNIVVATRGKLLQGPSDQRVRRVSIDSRELKKGDFFIAIKGERFDGHQFIAQAIRKKAAGIIVSRKRRVVSKGITVIRVEDTTKALGHIALAHRKQFSIPVVAITGSTGKTTTKEMVSAVLRKKFKLLRNTGTQNNQIGVPLTLLKLNRTHDIAVLELGTNRFGDIRWLAKITQPTVALYTNIGESHLEGLKSLQGVFREKSQLTNAMASQTTLIINTDDPYLKTLKQNQGSKRVITYGVRNKAQYRASHCKLINNRTLKFIVNNTYTIRLKTSSQENIYNALLAISCGRLFRISYNDINSALSKFSFPAGRQVVRHVKRYWVIDDTYNANPVSLRSAINTLTQIETRGRRVFVCADMLELGKRSRKLHESMGRFVANTKIDLLLTTGREARLMSQGAAHKNGHLLAYHFTSLDRLHRKLQNYCQPGDVILVKGSRSMQMERTVAYLTKNLS